jgi:glycerol-3-phosphate acyltransferase PlsX
VARDLTVSIDAMGGDAGPGVVVTALQRSVLRHSGVQFLLHGKEDELNGLLARHPRR